MKDLSYWTHLLHIDFESNSAVASPFHHSCCIQNSIGFPTRIEETPHFAFDCFSTVAPTHSMGFGTVHFYCTHRIEDFWDRTAVIIDSSGLVAANGGIVAFYGCVHILTLNWHHSLHLHHSHRWQMTQTHHNHLPHHRCSYLMMSYFVSGKERILQYLGRLPVSDDGHRLDIAAGSTEQGFGVCTDTGTFPKLECDQQILSHCHT